MQIIYFILLLILTTASAFAQLNPKTFELSPLVSHPSDPFDPLARFIFTLQYHPGPPDTNATWLTSSQFLAPGSGTHSVPINIGTLSHNGTTYRLAILREPDNYTNAILSANEVYIPYPFLSNTTVSVERPEEGSELVTIGYEQDIYSNSVTATRSSDAPSAFFRMWSPDNDPVNAIIQMSTNGIGGPWIEVTKEQK
jgi:hypothetical protein